MSDAPKRTCSRFDCNNRFELKHRAGRNSGRSRAGTKRRYHEGRLYCSDACRKLASKVRLSRLSEAQNSRPFAGTSEACSADKVSTPYQPSQDTKEAA
jgi:hypothetical protein